MEQTQILGLIGLAAGLIKIAILLLPQTQNKLSSVFTLACIGMIFQNAFEFFSTIITSYNGCSLTSLLLHSQLLSAIFFVFCLFNFTLTTVGSKYTNKLTFLFGLWGLICSCLLLSGHLVLGYERTLYSTISIPAKFYPLFSTYAVAALGSILFMLSRASLKANGEVRTRSLQILIATSPICLLNLAVQLLKLLNYNASTAFYVPIATTFFIAIMVLYKPDSFIALKIKWTVIWKLVSSMRGVKLSEWVEFVEKLMVKEAMLISDNNQTKAAKLIKSNQTTVGRKFKKYRSENDNNKKLE